MTPSGGGDDKILQKLKGVYAYSYTGQLLAIPPYAFDSGVPESGGYREATPPTASKAGVYQQIEGYVHIAFVGWINFHGNGKLDSAGNTQVGGVHQAAVSFNGTYTLSSVATSNGPVLVGEFITDPTGIAFTHQFVIADNGREIKFSVSDGSLRKLVAAGTLTRV